MKIGILTFHFAHNYGAMLQAYALSTKLRNMGYDAEIIDYRLPFIYKNHERLGLLEYWKSKPRNNILIALLKLIKNYPKYYKRPTKWYKFEHFLNTNLPISDRIYSKDEINQKYYDVIICGSDQIWNEHLTGKLIPIYFGDGINVPVKIAYAASNGENVIPKDRINDFSILFHNLTCVSIREKGLSDFLVKNGYLNTNVLDPVFLLKSNEWSEIALFPKKSGYVLTYSFNETDDFFDIASRVAKKLNKKLIVFAYEKKKISSKIFQYISGGPRDFIGYIMNADFIITNSFHGTAFSVIFRKQFVCIPPKRGRERIDAMLNVFGISNRIIENDSLDSIKYDINYNNALIQREISNSLDFITNSLIVDNI